MIKILIAEDHEILRNGLKSLLEDEPGIAVVGDAKNGQEAVDKISNSEIDIDVAILDFMMPVMNGLETTKYLNQHFKDVKVIILSMKGNDEYLSQMFGAGAKGYLLKSANKEELIYAIKKVAKGGMYVCSELTLEIMNKANKEVIEIGNSSVKLSKTELEILIQVGEGLTNDEIAAKLFKSRRTVETHRANLVEKTKSKNSAALIKVALLNGYIKS